MCLKFCVQFLITVTFWRIEFKTLWSRNYQIILWKKSYNSSRDLQTQILARKKPNFHRKTLSFWDWTPEKLWPKKIAILELNSVENRQLRDGVWLWKRSNFFHENNPWMSPEIFRWVKIIQFFVKMIVESPEMSRIIAIFRAVIQRKCGL